MKTFKINKEQFVTIMDELHDQPAGGIALNIKDRDEYILAVPEDKTGIIDLIEEVLEREQA